MENVAVFWGSFNPWTLAHTQVASEVLKQTKITKLILSPSGDRLDKDHWIDSSHRRNLIEIFYETLCSSGMNIELDKHFLEWRNWWNTTTAQEEKYFREKLWFSPSFIYWSDIVSQMPMWSGNENKFIEEKLKKIFITRPGYEFEPKKHWIENFILLDIPHMLDISSSMAKEMIQNKQSVNDILSPQIVEYIEKNKLYNN